VRFYILDDLVAPASGQPLRVADAQVEERDGPEVGPCVRWCGRHGSTPDRASAADCRSCARQWITSGTLSDGAERFTIEDGIPRFVATATADIDKQTQESFGFEWEHFDSVLTEYDSEFNNYFGIVPPELFRDAVALDAGCGMGRWALQVAKQPVRRLYAVDFSRAIDRAALTLAAAPHAHCVQADVCRLPFRPAAMSFSYCLGVLHHLQDPDRGMASLARVTNGALLTYLYYALDNRPRFHRALLSLVTLVRRVTCRLPKPAMLVLARVIAALLYWPLARLAHLLQRCGLSRLADQVPLSHYRDYSFSFMAGDAFDRFATPIERRYTRAQISAWLERYQRTARFSERTPFWVSLGMPRQ
jgi:SAM-dependent methyltransferase